MPEVMFQELADHAPMMVWRAGTDALCNWFNHVWLDFTGRKMEQEQGYGWAEGVHPDDLDACVSRYKLAFDAREKFSLTYRLRRHDGVYCWLLDNGAPYYKAGVFAGYFGTCVDISEQREAHDLVVAALAERDAMLREVYHRVKNNLQQIDGLIAIENAALTDPEGKYALDALSGRVRAMGAVHERLMSSDSLTELSVKSFMSDLCRDIGRGHGIERRSITLRVEVDDSTIHIERAVIVGLIVNELVTNALKHAFPTGRPGVVTVRYHRHGQRSTLEVADDGVGFVGGRDAPEASRRLGMRLVRGFVDQLDGTVEYVSVGGTQARVTLGLSATVE